MSDVKSEALEACPFCGSQAKLKVEDDHHGEFFELGCQRSECLGHWAYYTESVSDTPIDEAIAKWNTRAALEQKAEPVAWRSMAETPPLGKQVVVKTRRGIDVDEWKEFRESPDGLSSQTVRVGIEWAEHDFDEVVAWMDVDGIGTAPPSTAEVEARALEDAANIFQMCYQPKVASELLEMAKRRRSECHG